MPKLLSYDLRARVLAAVDAGLSCRRTAERFGVSPSSAIRWKAPCRSGGDVRSKPSGGDRLSHRTEAHAGLIRAALAEPPDITLPELKSRLAGRALLPAWRRSGATSAVTRSPLQTGRAIRSLGCPAPSEAGRSPASAGCSHRSGQTATGLALACWSASPSTSPASRTASSIAAAPSRAAPAQSPPHQPKARWSHPVNRLPLERPRKKPALHRTHQTLPSSSERLAWVST